MKTPQEILHDFYKDEGRLSQAMIKIIISELEGQKRGIAINHDTNPDLWDEITDINSSLDQRIDEWKKLL